jgi:Xaa-Pro aminopeptidase
MNRLICLFFCLLFSPTAFPQTSQYDTDLLSPEFHKQRRKALREKLSSNSVAVFFSAPVRNRSNDVDYQYHQDPDFYYLTGHKEPNSVLLVFKEEQKIGNMRSDEFLFVQDRNPLMEQWMGRRLGKEGAREKLGFSSVMLNSEFGSALPDFKKFSTVYVGLVPKGAVEDESEKPDLVSLIEVFKTKAGYPGNTDNLKIFRIMAALRQKKEAEEIRLLQKAIDMTCSSIKELMRALEPGMYEYQAQAIIEYGFKKEGSEYPGFPSIVGGGENSCILHYESNRKLLSGKDMLVSDVGAEYHGYSADVTRTLPVSGKFSPEQKLIYNLVLEAQQAGINECTKGKSFYAPGIAATNVIKKGLLELGIIKKESDYRKYFPHGTSHYLGLDVHDVGLYGDMQPGDVLTVEPGIYIPANSDCDPKWWNIGVRIEDDILITEDGNRNLSEAAPRKVEEIEALMNEKSFFNR